MKLSEIKLGQEIEDQQRGTGVVIKKTPRTVTIKFEHSTVKQSYKSADSHFSISMF